MPGKRKLFTKKDLSNHTWIVKVLIIIIYYPLALMYYGCVWILKMLWRFIQIIFGLILDAVDKPKKTEPETDTPKPAETKEEQYAKLEKV